MCVCVCPLTDVVFVVFCYGYFNFFFFSVSERKLFDRDHISALFSLPLQSGKPSPSFYHCVAFYACECVRVRGYCLLYCTVSITLCMFSVVCLHLDYSLETFGSQVILILYAS